MSKSSFSRRDFLKSSAIGAGLFAFPAIIPARVLGTEAPSKMIHIAQIGCGRIAHEMDMPGILKQRDARIVAVADVDSKRAAIAREMVEQHYAKKKIGGEVMAVGDYRQLLSSKDIDAVVISTPDHWHAQPVVEAALAGKDVYVQKPLAMTIAEGRAISDTIRKTGRVFMIGSQQRSMSPWPQFHRTCELVRNGRIGKLQTVKIGLPADKGTANDKEMPIPANLNYEMWIGSMPMVYYTEDRVHPQKGFGRPGYLRTEPFCWGMITGWGAHHVDIAHWGMGTELTGPVEVETKTEFLKGLWNVHGKFHATAKYANGVIMELDSDYPCGVRFEGSEGWIFVARSSGATASDPTTAKGKSFVASDPKILKSKIGENEIHLYQSHNHHGNFIECIKSRKETVTPVEVAHRSTSACNVIHTAMKLGRKLQWDPQAEKFVNDEAANAMLSMPQRTGYGTEQALKKA